jgi:hypothetical protein
MVVARFHLICGNCGSDNDWEGWRYNPEEVLDGEIINTADVYIYCSNCSTIHSLNMKAKQVNN